MPTSTAQHFCDAMATKRHLRRHFSSSVDKLDKIESMIAVDDKTLVQSLLIGAKSGDDRVTFVDGSVAERNEGYWKVGKDEAPFDFSMGTDDAG